MRWSALESSLRERVIAPGEPGFHDAQLGFNRLVPPGDPALFVAANGTADVLAAVRYASERGLPVAVQATGHGAALPVDGAVLIGTGAMTGVRVDPVARTAWAAAGTRWGAVVREAAAFGLAPLNGASPSVGVVSYSLGGGLGHLGRGHGYAADKVRSLDVVTADGRFRRVSAERDPDLFWAMRGGKGNFGVVTGIEFDLVEVPRLYGGALFLPGEAAERVLPLWSKWARDLPDAMQSGIAFIRFPDVPALPEPVRGRFLTHVRIAFTGPAEEGDRLVRPLREECPPLLDLVGEMPYARVGDISMDPAEPGVYYERSARLHALDDGAVDTLLEFVAEAAGAPRPGLELRQLGGALAAEPAHANAVPFRDSAFSLFSGGPVTAEVADVAHDFQERMLRAMVPWRLGGPFLSFISARENTVEHTRSAYDPETYRRLVRVKDAHDPANLFRINHNIPPTGWDITS